MTIGLIGCGAVVHELYAHALRGRSEYTVSHVCDLDPRQAASAAELFGARAAPFEAVVEAADFVIVSTPPSTHASLVRSVIDRRRPVMCEKPFMTSAEDARGINALAREMEVPVYVGHFRRTFPQVELARQLVTMGVIGPVTRVASSEGGRFTWNSVSSYTTEDPTGGVLWDTGSHTLDMALFAAAIDRETRLSVDLETVERDRAEPSHDFKAEFGLLRLDAGEAMSVHLHVSRKEALPNLVTIGGKSGTVRFGIGMDNRLRLDTKRGTVVLHAGRSHKDLIECFDLQMQRILIKGDLATFGASNFLAQIQILETLANV